MYVSGFEKDGSQDVPFTNNILVRGAKEVEQFRAQGFRFAYVFFAGPDPEGEAQAKGAGPGPDNGAVKACEPAVREADLEEAMGIEVEGDEGGMSDLVGFE